jgi:hypothetical protein
MREIANICVVSTVALPYLAAILVVVVVQRRLKIGK